MFSSHNTFKTYHWDQKIEDMVCGTSNYFPLYQGIHSPQGIVDLYFHETCYFRTFELPQNCSRVTLYLRFLQDIKHLITNLLPLKFHEKQWVPLFLQSTTSNSSFCIRKLNKCVNRICWFLLSSTKMSKVDWLYRWIMCMS